MNALPTFFKLQIFSHGFPRILSILSFTMHIRRANSTDLPDIATCSSKAFDTDPLSDYLHPYRHEHPESYRRYILNDCKRRFLQTGSLVMVAETDLEDQGADGKKQIVGSAFWCGYGMEEAARKEQNTYSWSMFGF